MNNADGSIAQLGEHLPYKQGVTGSSPVVPTKTERLTSVGRFVLLSIYQLEPVTGCGEFGAQVPKLDRKTVQ